MRRLLVAAIAVVGPTSCTLDGPTPDLELDMGSSCRTITLEVRDPDVLPGWQVHALAVERSGGERVWALASNPKAQLRLKAWPEGPDHPLSGLGSAGQFRLLAGSLEGETWLLLDHPTQPQVWRVDEGDGALIGGGQTIDLPQDHRWRLVFVGGLPYLIAVPVQGDASTIEMRMLALDPTTLAVTETSAVPLWFPCGEGPCDPSGLTGAVELDPVATSESGPSGGAALLIGIYERKLVDPPAADGLYRTELLELQLRALGPDRMPEVVAAPLYYPPSAGPVVFSPAFMVADSSGYYGLVGQTPLDGRPAPEIDLVFRVTRRQPFLTIATAQRSLRSHLLQVGARAAFGQVPGDTWTIAPLGPIGVDTELIAKLEVEPASVIASAGRGELLVRGDDAARRIVAACADEDE